MINSAGLDGEIPILQISRPAIMSSWLMVEGPISTKYASDEEAPASIPFLQEVSNRLLNSCPESGVIRLKYHPVGAGLNALFHKDKKPSDIDVAERGIAAGRSRPPDADALARQRAD